MTSQGVPVKVDNVSQWYGVMVVAGLVLWMTSPMGFAIFFVFALIAYSEAEKGIKESQLLVQRLESHYGIFLNSWAKTKAITGTIGWTSRINLGEVWTKDHNRKWDQVYLTVDDGTARLLTRVITAQGQAEYMELPTPDANATPTTTAHPTHEAASEEPPVAAPDAPTAHTEERSPFAPPAPEVEASSPEEATKVDVSLRKQSKRKVSPHKS